MFQRLNTAFLILLLLVFSATVTPAQAQILDDDFSSYRDGSRPPEGNWTIVGAVDPAFWTVRGGQLVTGNLDSYLPGLTFAFNQTSGSSNWTDIRVSVDATMESAEGSIAVAVRAKDFRNYYYALLSSSIVGGSPQRSLEIYKLINGTPLPIAQLGVGSGPRANIAAFEGGRQTIRLELEASGSTLTAIVNGEALLTATDTEFPSGTVAVGGRFVEASFDRVTVSQATGVRASAAPAGPAATAGGDEWRIRILGDLSQTEAEEYAGFFRNEGLDNVAVLRRNGTYSVYTGLFRTENEARTKYAQLDGEGFVIQAVERITATGAAATATPTPGRGGSGSFRVLAGSFSRREDAENFRTRLEGAGYIVDIESTANSHRVVSSYVFNDRASAEALVGEMRSLASSAGVVEVDGTSSGIDLAAVRGAISSVGTGDAREEALRLFDAIENARNRGLTNAERAQIDNDIANMPPAVRQVFDELQRVRTLEALRADYRRSFDLAVGARDFDRADRLLREWKSKDPTNTAIDDLIQDLIRRTTASAARPTMTPAVAALPAEPAPMASSSDGSLPVGLIIAVVVAVAVVGAVAFVLLKKKSAPAPAPAQKAVPAVPVAAKKTQPAPPKTEAKKSAPEAKKPTKPAAADKPEMIKPVVEQNSPLPLSVPGFITEDEVKAEDAQEEAPVVPTAAPAPEAPAESIAIPAAVKPSFATPVKIADLYVQNFDNEETGAMPTGWKGEYDYASLKVVERKDAVGGKCLRFEKRSGTGSAFYSCKFPDVSGRFTFEFDICCEDKNKYLLGFYLELDEEFRHAVHTVVHKDMSKSDVVTLRVQNESTPYDLGSWSHVKVNIDLERHVIDGYVDDKPVVVGARLPSKPKALNTLSIRDNLATEGILLIDNVRIFRSK